MKFISTMLRNDTMNSKDKLDKALEYLREIKERVVGGRSG